MAYNVFFLNGGNSIGMTLDRAIACARQAISSRQEEVGATSVYVSDMITSNVTFACRRRLTGLRRLRPERRQKGSGGHRC
jgi:hypothetical protein